MATYKYEGVINANKDDHIHTVHTANALLLIGVKPTAVDAAVADHAIKIDAQLAGEETWFHVCEWDRINVADANEATKLYPSNLSAPYFAGLSAIRITPADGITATYWVNEFYHPSQTIKIGV